MIDRNYIASVIAAVAFDIIYFRAAIGTIAIVTLDGRSPAKTTAWILILVFLPVIGLVLYFLLDIASGARRLSVRKVTIDCSKSR